MNLIGISGKAGSGKDTAAKILLEELGDSWQTASFAEPVKAMLEVIGVDCYSNTKNDYDPVYDTTPRDMMQTLGTNWGRNLIHEDLWVRVFQNNNQGKSLVVPDVRFENEADFIREHGCMIHIVGRGGLKGTAGEHESEKGVAIKEGDFIIDNGYALHDLREQIEDFLYVYKDY